MRITLFDKGYKIPEIGFTDKWMYKKLKAKGLTRKTYPDREGDFSYTSDGLKVYFNKSTLSIHFMHLLNQPGPYKYLDFAVVQLNPAYPVGNLTIINSEKFYFFVRYLLDNTIVKGKNAGYQHK